MTCWIIAAWVAVQQTFKSCIPEQLKMHICLCTKFVKWKHLREHQWLMWWLFWEAKLGMGWVGGKKSNSCSGMYLHLCFGLLALRKSVLTVETGFHLKEGSLGVIPVRYWRYFFLQWSERENMREGKKDRKKSILNLLCMDWLSDHTVLVICKMLPFGLPCRPADIHLEPPPSPPTPQHICHLHLLYLFLPPISWSHERWNKKETHFSPLNLSVPHFGLATLWHWPLSRERPLSILTDHLQGVVPLMIDSHYVRVKAKPQPF